MCDEPDDDEPTGQSERELLEAEARAWKLPQPKVPDFTDENGRVDLERMKAFLQHLEAQQLAILGLQARHEGAAAAGEDPDVALPRLLEEFKRIHYAQPGELPPPRYDVPGADVPRDQV